jgi:uridine kinase
MTGTRSALLDKLADTVIELHIGAPTLVAIDGRSAAGKTMLADELAQYVQHKGRPTLRSSLDHFHPSGHRDRSGERRYTPSSYLAEGYDYTTFRRCMLDPFQPDGSRRVQLAFWDSYNDTPLAEQWIDAPTDVVVIIDGIFLLRPDLRTYWDYTIWLDIDWQTMIERAAGRDSAWVGSPDVVVERYRSFWIPTHELYERAMTPRQFADVIVDHRNPETPCVMQGQADP